jgi:hypothetical protein
MGRYLDLNKERTVPHSVILPIELYLPYIFMLKRFELLIINTKNL